MQTLALALALALTLALAQQVAAATRTVPTGALAFALAQLTQPQCFAWHRLAVRFVVFALTAAARPDNARPPAPAPATATTPAQQPQQQPLRQE